MKQSDLFAELHNQTPFVLNMPDAKVSYQSAFVSQQKADHYFSVLERTLAWRQDHIRMYGKEVKIPRLQAWYGEPESAYSYSGLTMQPLPWTQALMELKGLCEQAAQCQFNSVLANYYRDGQDSMAMHSDDEPELGKNPIIASLSLGESRDFDLRHKRTREKQRVALQHGSLLIMGGNTQQYWQHGISKCRAPLGGRINLTFRTIYQLEK